jgi:oligopeptide/dipeptide ABC transporter ATP-binding protein
MPLLEVTDLSVAYAIRSGFGRHRRLRAVQGVSLALERGESLGLVGESGCGKSSLGRALLGLEPLAGGSVRFEGEEVAALSGPSLERFRRRAQMVFQDPMGSLNPRLTIGGAIGEVLRVHRVGSRRERRRRVAALLERVGLDAAHAHRYPHELSGGQRQRAGLARALALEPELIVADEPVSSLDVSIQVQVLNLLNDLQAASGVSYLLIAHDLAVVQYVCRRVMVMYGGRVVEGGDTAEVLSAPAHPYTAALRAAVFEPDGAPDTPLPFAVPAGALPPAAGGCPFRPRCPWAVERCVAEAPGLGEVGPGHRSACHLAGSGRVFVWPRGEAA